MKMLVDPTPHPLKGMIPLQKFQAKLRATELDTLRARAKGICESEIEDFEPLRIAMRRRLEKADEGGHLLDELIIVSLELGSFSVFAYLPSAASCYEIERFYWSYFKRDALEAIETGRTRLPIGALFPQSIESDLANRPLFVSEEAVKKLLNPRPPANKVLDMLAVMIISEHQDKCALKMRKGDFVKRLIELAPGCNKERAEGAWAKHAPPDWKRPGRPRRS